MNRLLNSADEAICARVVQFPEERFQPGVTNGQICERSCRLVVACGPATLTAVQLNCRRLSIELRVPGRHVRNLDRRIDI